MKVVLFDLGRTLEFQDQLLPGAAEVLATVQQLKDAAGVPVALGLVSDYDMPESPLDVPAIQESYFAILETLGIRSFFEPVSRQVTLSTDVGVFKPDERIFRRALDKIAPDISFGMALFVTENAAHVAAARALGMRAVHFRGPGQTNGEVLRLRDLIPLIHDFVNPESVGVGISTARTALARIIAPVPGVSWARFGDDVFLFGNAVGLSDTAARLGQSELRKQSPEVRRDYLHLVIQKGRLFQHEYPDVPVLLDRGRYLVVALDPARAVWLSRHHRPCYTIRPLDDRFVAFETRTRLSDRTAEVPWVRVLVDSLSQAEYETDLTRLASFPTRHSTSTGYADAAMWASTRFKDMGYQTENQTIDIAGGTSLNIVANRPGGGQTPRGVVVVTAHLDSINLTGGPSALAPGADDNASGSAGVLAIARTLCDHANADDLRLILFGGEEQGLFGSRQYVDRLSADERDRILAVVNMDMIACRNRSPSSVLLEGATTSQPVIDGLAEAAATYTELIVETSLNPFASDHVPFIERSLPAVLTIEGADQSNSNIHSGNDVLSHINYEIAMEILRMNVGFLALAVG